MVNEHTDRHGNPLTPDDQRLARALNYCVQRGVPKSVQPPARKTRDQ